NGPGDGAAGVNCGGWRVHGERPGRLVQRLRVHHLRSERVVSGGVVMVLLYCNRDDVALIASGISNAVVHEPVGNPGGPGLWHHKNMQLPAYVQHIANDLIEGGMDTSRA